MLNIYAHIFMTVFKFTKNVVIYGDELVNVRYDGIMIKFKVQQEECSKKNFYF